jgi:hypothetical protein
MASIGFTVFGRPIKHEYISNGLFDQLGINSESYLDENISLEKDQSIAIIKRFKDANGVEVLVVFLNTYAISYNDRAGGFVGAGVAFVGKPSVKLIYDRLTEIYRQSLKLVHPETGKFIEPIINKESIKLPNYDESGLLIDIKAKTYNLQSNINIGVKIKGNFHENLMSTIQGFVNNESFFRVKTAYVTKHENLLRKLINPKYIYSVHHLLDYSRVFKNHHDKIEKSNIELNNKVTKFKKKVEIESEKLEEREKKIDIEQTALEKKREEIKSEEESISKSKDISKGLNEKIEELKEAENDLNKKLESKRDDLKLLEKNKLNTFLYWINLNKFDDERKKYEDSIIKEENQKRKPDENKSSSWFNIFLVGATLIFMISTAVLSYSYYENNSNNSANQSIIANCDNAKEKRKSIELPIPIIYTANNFLKLDSIEQKEHKDKLDLAISLLINDEYKSGFDNYNLLSDRKWNFREVLDKNVEGNIDEGLERLVKIKKLSSIKDTTLFYSPRFLISKIEPDGNQIISKEFKYVKNINDFLKSYLKDEENIYEALDFEYKKRNEGSDSYQEIDPVLLMHFRWMAFNFEDQKKDIQKLKDGESIKLPIFKK